MPSATAGTTAAEPVSDGQPTIVSRRLACTNRVWNVYFTHVTDGPAEVVDYLVVEPKNRSTANVTGVAILPVVNGRIGLVRIGRVALDAVFIEAPKGFIDAGEDAQSAAQRELTEETGLVCDASDIVALGSVTPEASTLAARTGLFAALRCRPVEGARDAEIGLSGFTFVSLAEARSLAAGDGIEDATTVAALYRLFAKAESDPMVRAALMG